MSAAVPCTRLEETRRLVSERLADTISGVDGRALKAHVASCASCRGEALRLDPTLLFSPLASPLAWPRPSRSDEFEARRLSVDVLSAIELERARRRIAPPLGRTLVRAASVAILAGGVMTLLHIGRRPHPPAGADRGVAAAAASPSPASPAAAATAAAAAPLLIDHLGNPGATVYQFASSSPREPNVVFVVDQNADI